MLLSLRRRKNPFKELEKSIGYDFRRINLLETALMHRSFRFENSGITSDNQRMEFLGDAVLGFATAAHLYEKHNESDEGDLTSFRSQTTNGQVLAEIARSIDLGAHIKMGKGEENSGGRKRESNLADALESVIGAAYLDGGLKAVQKIFDRLFVPMLENLSGDVWEGNPKGKLQELSQRKWKCSPHYRIISKEGPPHATIFTVEVILDDGITGVGRGRNKQEAEAQAASEALSCIERHKKRH
ncbi:MAG: ribonuclease III [Kiritimatiellae bacterium]|nr:ribonuclease III [Kiritimatiellia bacterium]MDD5520413.1 ribonuclease III [Kiritimatiellia bacterium]